MSRATWGAREGGRGAAWHCPGPSQVSPSQPPPHLEEVAGDERSLDVEHVGVGAEGGGRDGQLDALHHFQQLSPHDARQAQRLPAHPVLAAPALVRVVCGESGTGLYGEPGPGLGPPCSQPEAPGGCPELSSRACPRSEGAVRRRQVLPHFLAQHLRCWKALKMLMRVKWSPSGWSRARRRVVTASSRRVEGGTKQGGTGEGAEGWSPRAATTTLPVPAPVGCTASPPHAPCPAGYL